MTQTDVRCTAIEAVQRARDTVASHRGHYQLGTGDYHPRGPDTPWGPDGGSDCAGFAICYAWKLVRHRPGYNRGPWASVSDDINVNSLMEDAAHAQELAIETPNPRPGDLLCYPSFSLHGADGAVHHFIGHVGIILAVPAAWTAGRYEQLSVAQCCGPNGRTPGVLLTEGSVWAHHDTVWPKPEHRTRIIRMMERT